MVYYTSNLITSQKGTLFSGDDYENLCRVYSVWLCPMAAQEQPAIDQFGMNVSRVFGEGSLEIPPEYYDLQKILFCQFNLYSKLQGVSVHRFLQLLLTECAPVEERLNELHRDYGITITKESETMCNLTYELYIHAKHEGEIEGEIKGEIKGRIEGEIKGKNELRLEVYRKMKDNHMEKRRFRQPKGKTDCNA